METVEHAATAETKVAMMPAPPRVDFIVVVVDVRYGLLEEEFWGIGVLEKDDQADAGRRPGLYTCFLRHNAAFSFEFPSAVLSMGAVASISVEGWKSASRKSSTVMHRIIPGSAISPSSIFGSPRVILHLPGCILRILHIGLRSASAAGRSENGRRCRLRSS